MNNSNCQTSVCRHCRHFSPEGRRGGNCEQLSAPVRGGWKACSLALPAFAPSWEGLESLELWQHQPLTFVETISADSSTGDRSPVRGSQPNLSVVQDDRDQDLALA